jgi:hypothetical protein
MQAAGQPGQISKKAIWTGRVLSGLITVFLLFDAVIHILKPAPVVEAFAKLNFPLRFSVPLGVIELACILLYVLPATSTLGAILLTGYLGGAIAIQLPTGNSFFGEVLFPLYTGAILWAGIYLRDEQLRALVPWQR